MAEKNTIACIGYISANPPTKEYATYFDNFLKTLKKSKGEGVIYLNPEVSIQKAPLPLLYRKEYLEELYPAITFKTDMEVTDAQKVIEQVFYAGYETIYLCIDASQMDLFKEFKRYETESENETEVHFKKVSILTCYPNNLEEVPSKVQLLNAVLDNDLETFSSVCLTSNEDMTLYLFKLLKNAMGLAESFIPRFFL